MDSTEVLRQMWQEGRDEVSRADDKSSIIFGAMGIVLGAQIAALFSEGWQSSTLGMSAWTWWAGLVFFMIAAASAGAAVWPRYRQRSSKVIYYWGDVAGFDNPAALRKSLAEQALPSDEERLADQLWIVSRIVAHKFRLIRVSLACGAVGAVLVLAALVTRSFG